MCYDNIIGQAQYLYILLYVQKVIGYWFWFELCIVGFN